jgi:hypothetical protein
LLGSTIPVGATMIQHGTLESCQPIPVLRGALLHMQVRQGYVDLEMISLPLACFGIKLLSCFLSLYCLHAFTGQVCIVFHRLLALHLLPARMKQDISTHQLGGVKDHPDAHKADTNVDCLIVGAGFGGVYLLHHLRKAGYSCKIFEAGADLGGIWHWNCYPGARVDSQVPVYEYSILEVWKDWTWTEAYPAWPELREYFDHVDKVLDIKKDVQFNTHVTGADYDLASGKWRVTTEDGQIATSRFLIVAAGFAAKRHFPDWKGLDTFKGEIHHSSFWPQEGVDFKGKRIGVIGTGKPHILTVTYCI